jgi:fatty acid desaturase
MARYLRGLECLVHEASHCNWNRRRSLNDAFANVLAALPVFSRVAPYRRQHLVHHALLGTDLDPDLVRYRQFDLESLDRSSVRRFTLEIVARLPRYTKEWFGAIGTDRATLLLSLLWHGLGNLSVALVFGVDYAVLFATHWAVAFVVCLPIIRIIAESSEHRYSDAKTVLGSTVSNLGWIHRLVFHPHWDGHHVIHHLWPAVPHHRLNALHNDLLRVDPDNYGKGLRFRTRVLEQPATVLDE